MGSAAQALHRALQMARNLHAFVPSGSSLLLRRTAFTAARPVSAGLSPRAPFVLHSKPLNGRSWPLGHYSTVVSPQAADPASVEPLAVEPHAGNLAATFTKDTVPSIENGTAPSDLHPNVPFADGFDEALITNDVIAAPTAVAAPVAVPKKEPAAQPKVQPKVEPEVEQPDGLGPPVSSFRISPVTVEALAKNSITHVTEVQGGTFDLLYDGADVIAKSRTGTGKTLAFALPILERLAIIRQEQGRRPRGLGPGCIVLAPTRELAKQVSREMAYIGRGLGLSVECVYGGSSYGPQESALRRGVDVVVGTPGRIIDHLGRGTLKLDNISFAVLDEADEMLSMGFAEDVEQVFQTLPAPDKRQVILFSATVPHWVKRLASQYQKGDVKMFDGVSSGTQAATTVRHCAVRVPERDDSRASLLADIIAVHSRSNPKSGAKDVPSRAIVFTQTKKEADELVACGILDGCGAAVLHGDVSQRQRESTLSQFRQGRFQVLVATDVAARGLDISGVDVVVQYRVPRDSDAYIHRAGRTGRAGKSGTAVVLFSDRELRSLRDLEYQCKIKFERESAPAPELALDAAVDFALQTSHTVDARVRKHLEPLAQKILDSPDDALSTLAGILAVAGRRTKLEDRSVLSGETGMRTLHIKSNREISPAVALRVLSDLAEEAGKKTRVGLIRICVDGSAVVDVPSGTAEGILELSTEGTDMTVVPATLIPPLRESDHRSGGNRSRDRRGGGGRSYSRGRNSYSGGYRRDGGGYGGGGGGGGGYNRGRNDRYSSRDGGYSRGNSGGDRQSRNRYGDSRNFKRDSGGYGGYRDGDYGNSGGRRASMIQDDF